MTAEPIMTDLTVDYYEALSRGQLVVQECGDCGALIMYPRYRCTECFSSNLGWKQVEGSGILLSFTILRMGAPSGYEEDLPYAVGIVKLDDGPQLLGRLWPAEDGTWDHYVCDGRVRFRSATGVEIARRPAPWFTRAEG